MKRKSTLKLFMFALLGLSHFTTEAQTLPPFECTGNAYQVAGPAVGNSSLFSYNVATGVRTLIGELPSKINATGYSSYDNYIWGYDMVNNLVVKIGADATSLSYSIPNLPSYPYNVGDIVGDGYLFLYIRDTARYYVVDINPMRPTYLSLVDPTASYTLDASPYGTSLSGQSSGLKVSDLAYSPSTGMLYGMVDPTGGNAFKIITLDPNTGNVTFSATTASGAGIQTETSAYGSVFTDQGADKLYVFANTLGKFFEVDRVSNTAVLLSTSIAALNNDGASCTSAFLTAAITGNVFHDPDGGFVNNSTGLPNTAPDGLFANLVSSSGIVTGVSAINSAGIFGFNNIASGDYTVVLSTVNGTIGLLAPSPDLLPGWMNTGEFNGLPGSGNTAPVDGISDTFILSGTTVSNINFGIQQHPSVDEKEFTMDETAFSSTPPTGFPVDPDYKSIPMSSPYFTGYPTGGALSGSDPEDCVAESSCNTGTSTTFKINSINDNTKLYYDFGGVIGVVEIDVTNGPVAIEDFDFNNLVIYGQYGTGTIGNEIGFTYSMTDAAGATSDTVGYRIGTLTPLPISLKSFDVLVQNNVVQLKWLTAREQNNHGFEVGHSADGRTWRSIGFVNSKAKEGNSMVELLYTYTDNNPIKGPNFYRLKQTDVDGKFEYSVIRQVSFDDYTAINIYPNPAKDYVTIDGLEGNETIRIYDAVGRVLRTIKASQKSVIISLSGVGGGLCNIRIIDANGIVVLKKMMKIK